MAYNGHCVKMTSLNYVLWGLLASIKDNAFGGPSVSSSFAHLAFATAYAAYKAENNDENEAAATAFWEELVFRWQECNFIILVILMFGMYWIYLMQSKTE